MRDDAGSATPLKANEAVREVMMSCHESMRMEGIVPSIEAYHIVVTAVSSIIHLPSSIRLSVQPSMCTPHNLFFPIYLSIYLSIHLSIFLFHNLSIV